MDQYFNGKEWFTKSPGGDTGRTGTRWSPRTRPSTRSRPTRTLIVGGETLDRQEVTFTFTNHACTKLTWSMASGPSATYVDGKTQP